MSESKATHSPAHVWPTLNYADADAAIAFLTEGLGFSLAARHPDDSDVVRHAELRWPEGGGVMLSDTHRDGGIITTPAGVGSVYLVVGGDDRVNYLRESSEAAGATIVRDLEREDYGSYGFTITDPQGTHWSIGTYPGE